MPISRRRFLASTSALAAASFIRPASGASGGEPVIVGSGSHRYQWIEQWGDVPPQIKYGLTHGIIVDQHRFVHVLHTSRKDSESKDCVVVFDPSGKFVRSWGDQFVGGAHGFDVFTENGQEVIYITDLVHGLSKMTLDGKLLWHVENPRPDWYKEGKLKYRPSNVAVVPATGDVFFSDGYGSFYIHKLDRSGTYVKTFGGPGWDKGQTNHPHGLFIDHRGSEPLLIVGMNDMGGTGHPGMAQAFNLDGEHHSFWPTDLRSPRSFDRLGDLVVIPDLDARVTLVDASNKPVAQLGDAWTTKDEVRGKRNLPRDGFTPGQFVCPHDAAFDKDGSIFVSEWAANGRIIKLQKLA